MRTLLVFVFDDETGAQGMIETVQALQKQQWITLSDAALVIRKKGCNVQVKQVNSLVGAGALGGAFWGMMMSLLFWTYWQEPAANATTMSLGSRVLDYGLEDAFIRELSSTIAPGYSALFMIVEYMTEDKVLAELARHKAMLLRTNLSDEDDARLREVFGVVEMV